MEAGRLDIQGHFEFTMSSQPGTREALSQKRKRQSLNLGALGKVVAVAILFKSEGLLATPCQAPGLLESSLILSSRFSFAWS